MGFFYREKMRAIHRVAPDEPLRDILEVGGGQSGLTALLYPEAHVTNLDYGALLCRCRACNRQDARHLCLRRCHRPSVRGRLVRRRHDVRPHRARAGRRAGDGRGAACPPARRRPAREHATHAVALPALRVHEAVRSVEESLFEEWGHVRRGYTLEDLGGIIGLPCTAWSSFINPVTSLNHDISFSTSRTAGKSSRRCLRLRGSATHCTARTERVRRRRRHGGSPPVILSAPPGIALLPGAI